MSGSVEFIDEAPRRLMLQLSSPGALDERVIITPGTCPCKAWSGEDSPPLFSNAFESTTVTAPVSDSFFCTPKPTTTSSSSAVSSAFIWMVTVAPLTVTVWSA